MAVTSFKYEELPNHLAQKLIDFDSDSFGCILLSAYTPDTANHKFLSDVLAAGTETSGTGYTAGGATLTSVTWVKTTGVWAFKGTIPAWNATGGALTAKYAVFFDKTPSTNATRPVMCYWNLNGGADVTATNDTFTLTQNASGILTVS